MIVIHLKLPLLLLGLVKGFCMMLDKPSFAWDRERDMEHSELTKSGILDLPMKIAAQDIRIYR